jgi:hypothetical protein
MLALLSILNLFQGIPFPGPGMNFPRGNQVVIINSCGVRSTVSVTIENVALNGASCQSTGLTPASGHIEIIFLSTVQAQSSPSCAATDTNGNTWTTTSFGGTNNRTMVCMSQFSSTGNATETVNFASSAVAILTLELSGAQNSLDGSVTYGTIASSASWTWPSLTTANNNDIVIGFAGDSGTSHTWTQVLPWTFFNAWSGSATVNTALVYQIVTSTAAYAPKINLSTSVAGAAVTIAVKST